MSEWALHWPVGALALVGGLALITAGCRSTAPRQGASGHIHPREDVIVNAEQARLRMRTLVEPFCGAIVASADRIGAGTTNRAIHREALLWKIEALSGRRGYLGSPLADDRLL
jgi:hypothetical protein